MRNGIWNPYVAGALVGLLAIVSVVATTRVLGRAQYLGASTTFVRVAGLVERQVVPRHAAANEYFTKTKIKIDWQMMFIAGIFIGSLVSSLMGGTFRIESVPPIWRERFGGGVGTRAMGAFFGGMIAIFGARLAGGCPSGHGLSGVMQLAGSGLVAMACFMAGGLLTARMVYGRQGRGR
ncbi:MAG: YeeE/YedE family protein [Deltaproteobacteria bacterium]|nr:YeeE/YedE family protein [Candidatus Anaeroferrophillacea bacterium]